MSKWMCVLLAGLSTLLMAACGGPAKPASEGPPPYEISIKKVEQWSALGNQAPDGQYVVVLLNIKNTSNATQNLAAWDFEIQNITTKPEEQYSQVTEAGIANPFFQAYGAETAKLLLDKAAHVVHPRMEVQRYVVYQLPKDAFLSRYQLYFKPQDLKMPLEGDDVEVTDHRDSSDVPVEEEG